MHEQSTSLVILDDDEMWLSALTRMVSRILGSASIQVKPFLSDAEASNYVKHNKNNIVGYIQDINRNIYDASDLSGVHFLNNIVAELTPSARCLIVSGQSSLSLFLKLFKSHGYKINYLHKADLSEMDFSERVKWLIEADSTTDELRGKDVDPKSATVIELINPPWREIITELSKTPKLLHTIDARLFERLVAEIFRSYGWEVELTSKTKDGGYDIIAVQRNMPSDMKILIEAKRYHPDRSVGVGIIRSLYGLKSLYPVNKVMLATSSYVSLPAKKEFQRITPWELDYLERDKILSWCMANSGADKAELMQLANNPIQPTQKSLRAFWSADW